MNSLPISLYPTPRTVARLATQTPNSSTLGAELGAQIVARNSLPTAFAVPPRCETVDPFAVVVPQLGAYCATFPPPV